MTKVHEAGTLILSQLKTFNESVVYFENMVEPAFFDAIDSCVKKIYEDSEGWCGESELANDSNCWLAPDCWNTNPDEEDPDLKAWFEVDMINADDNKDYWTSLFCGVGSASGEAGFMFRCQVKEFGGKVAWKNHIKSQEKFVYSIEKLGFKNQNNGSFFLPVRIDFSELAKTWDDAGELKGDDDCFQPVRDALETVAQSVPLFDALMQKCQAPSKKKP